jgi:hypothetical protein
MRDAISAASVQMRDAIRVILEPSPCLAGHKKCPAALEARPGKGKFMDAQWIAHRTPAFKAFSP